MGCFSVPCFWTADAYEKTGFRKGDVAHDGMDEHWHLCDA